MAGVTLDTFVDVFLATSQAILTGPTALITEAQKRRTLLKQILNSHEFSTMLQGGDTITDQIMFGENKTYGAYNPLQPKTPNFSNNLTEISVNWAFADASVSFSKHEKGINGINDYRSTVRAMKFKDVIYSKWANLFVNVNNGMERELFAPPNSATMETVTGGGTRVPLSVFCTITEFGAVYANQKPTGLMPPGFTTVQNVSSTTQPLWTNPVQTYLTSGPGSTATDTNEATPTDNTITTTNRAWDGFGAMSKMYDRLYFEELAIRPEYGEVSDPEGFIFCSLRGKSLWENNTALANNYLRNGPSNPAYAYAGTGLNYNGVPVKYVEFMDFAGVWRDAEPGTILSGEFDVSTDEDGGALGNPQFEGPRYVWIVPKYFKVIMHKDHFLEEERPPASVFQPYERVVYFDCWHQTFNRSRQRAGGVVTPGADITANF